MAETFSRLVEGIRPVRSSADVVERVEAVVGFLAQEQQSARPQDAVDLADHIDLHCSLGIFWMKRSVST